MANHSTFVIFTGLGSIYMDDAEYQNAIKALNELASAVTPNTKEQYVLLMGINEIKNAPSVSDRERVRTIIGMFYDGLAYGNWPWIKNGVNVLEKSDA